MQLLATTALLLLSIQGVSSIVFSCEEVKKRLINSPRIENTVFACVFLEEGLNPTTSYLNDVFIQDTQDQVSYSLSSIAASPTGCVRGSGPWQVISDKPNNFNCNKELTVIFNSDANVEYIRLTKNQIHRDDDGRVVLVSPGSGMKINIKNLNGAAVVIYTGAGKNSQELLYELTEYNKYTVPNYILSFDNVITIDSKNTDIIIYASTDYQSATRLEPGDRAAVMSSGMSDNLMNKHPLDNYAIFNMDETASVDIQGMISLDREYKGSINVSISGDIMNQERAYNGDYNQAWFDWIVYGTKLEVKYLTGVSADDIWDNDDTFVIDILMSELPTGQTTVPTVQTTPSTTTRQTPPQTTAFTTDSYPTTTTTTTTRVTTTPTTTTTSYPTYPTTTTTTTTRPSEVPSTVRTTQGMVTTTSTVPVPDVKINGDYCNCRIVDEWFDDWDPSEIWVDVIILLDTSASMSNSSLEEAKSLITSFLGLMSTDIYSKFYSRIGVIAVSDTVDVVYKMNMSSTDNLNMVKKSNIPKIDVGAAFQAALRMFAEGEYLPGYRENAKQIIYYLTNSAPGSNMNGVDDFKTNGGTIIVNDFVLEGGFPDPDLKKLASEHFFFIDLSENYIKSLGLFCEINCFCDASKHSFNDDVLSPRTQANRGCFHPINNGIPQPKARETCQNENAALVSIHDQQKEHFVNSVVSVFGNKKKYWIGYENVNNEWQWDDESTAAYSNWDADQPNTSSNKNCAYSVQTTGLNTKWSTANCAAGGIVYICESAPCSRGNTAC